MDLILWEDIVQGFGQAERLVSTVGLVLRASGTSTVCPATRLGKNVACASDVEENLALCFVLGEIETRGAGSARTQRSSFDRTDFSVVLVGEYREIRNRMMLAYSPEEHISQSNVWRHVFALLAVKYAKRLAQVGISGGKTDWNQLAELVATHRFVVAIARNKFMNQERPHLFSHPILREG